MVGYLMLTLPIAQGFLIGNAPERDTTLISYQDQIQVQRMQLDVDAERTVVAQFSLAPAAYRP